MIVQHETRLSPFNKAPDDGSSMTAPKYKRLSPEDRAAELVQAGLRVLEAVRAMGMPVLTDIHDIAQAREAATVMRQAFQLAMAGTPGPVVVGLPEDVIAKMAGTADAFAATQKSQPWMILGALVAVYLVLGVLYESYIHPLTILSTLPSAGVGALLALYVTGGEFSLISLLGLFLLIGVVKKNAILMIDLALQLERHQGFSPEESIRRACLLRLRPILMTTLAAILGALPLLLSQAEGAEMRQPLGLTIIGGLVFSQILTLYTTPVVYLYLDRLRHRFNRWRGVRTDAALETPL